MYFVEPLVWVSMGDDPPLETVIPLGAAAGAKEPSAWGFKVMSTGIQALFRRIRVGAVVVEVVNEPSGFATVVDVCDVNASTGTGFPVDAAVVLAEASFAGVEASVVETSGPEGPGDVGV